MRDFFRKKTWIITVLMIIAAVGLSMVMVYFEFSSEKGIKVTEASSGDNVSGYAWSENIGWVSMNCTNDNSCGTANYGVSVNNDTGYFSGYGWSPNIGWIDFAPTSGYPEEPNTGAHYDSATGVVTGWAKILSLGDNGWLKMSGGWTNGVIIDSSGDFYGFAWNGNSDGSGLGWLSFNCADTGSCAASDYKASAQLNQLPTAINLSAINWNFSQAGEYGALRAILRWQFSDSDVGSAQTAYQLVVSRYSDFSTPILDTGKTAGIASQYQLTVGDNLNYNTAYYWRVKVWDDRDAASDWVNYNTTPDTDNNDGVVGTFSTYKHEMPDPNFSWSPESPSKGQEIQLDSSASKIYFTSAPISPVDCSGGCSYHWEATANATFDNADIANPKLTLNSTGNVTLTLTLTDGDGYVSTFSRQINVNVSLPTWKEKGR